MRLSDRIEQMVHPVHALPHEIDTLIDHWFGHKPKGGQKKYCPRTDIVERETDFVVSMELPGVGVGDVAVEATDEQLVVSGEKKVIDPSDDNKLHRRERNAGEFNRVFEFPTQVDFDQINAVFDSGVLTITVPKSAKVLPRKIQINVED